MGGGTATVAWVEFKIDVTSKRASYLQLADQIRAAIESGGPQPRDQIPSLHQFADQTGLAVGTIQKAIRKLEQES